MSTPQDPFASPGNEPSRQDGAPPPSYGQQPQYGQPQYGQPQYGQPGYGGQGAKKNGFGIAALVLGILALLGTITLIGGILFGILAIVFGILGRGRAKKGEADNGGMALTGIILGGLALVISVIIVVAGVSLLNSDTGQELQDCINSATTQAEIDQCRVEFEDSFRS